MRPWRLIWCTALLAGCGGGGGDKSSGNAPGPAPVKQSPGGIWHSLGGPADALTMLIAETGELIVMSPEPSFGNGAVIVNNGTEVAGTYLLRTLQPSVSPVPLPGPAVTEQTCAIEGTVTQRVSLQLTITCTDNAGNVTDRTVGLAYNPAYETDSSLTDIAGNYTLPFGAQTNVLNINSNGVIFGTFQNGGANCTVNGQVEIIEPRFNLYRFRVVFSLCQGIFTLPGGSAYEGMELTGLAARNLPGMPNGAFLLVIFGASPTPMDFFSVLYEPV